MITTNGLPNRFDPKAVAVAKYLGYKEEGQFRTGRCFLNDNQLFSSFDQKGCLPDRPGRPNYVLWGDSFAAQLFHGLSRALPDANVLQVTGVRCEPLMAPQPDPGRACPALMDLVANRLPSERKIAKVFLAADWNRGQTEPIFGWSTNWMSDLLKTVTSFRDRGVEAVVVGPVPEYSGPLPRILAEAVQKGRPDAPQAALSASSFALDQKMAQFMQSHGIAYVSLIAKLCPDHRCMTYVAPGVPLQFDNAHLGEGGSAIAAQAITASIN